MWPKTRRRDRRESLDSGRERNAVFRSQWPDADRMGFFNGLLSLTGGEHKGGGPRDRPPFFLPVRQKKHSAISSQRSAKIKRKNQNQCPRLPKFPAYGVFLLKRPKGTKSRRWAPACAKPCAAGRRGLPYAKREHAYRIHTMRWPGTRAGTSNPVAGRISALCSGSSPVRKFLRRAIGV